jgi:hypothetical protein
MDIKRKYRMIAFVLIMPMIIYLFFNYGKTYDIQSLTGIKNLDSGQIKELNILKRNSFLGEKIKHVGITDQNQSKKILKHLETYKLRKIFTRGPENEVNYFIGAETYDGKDILRLVVQGNNYMYIRDKRGVFNTYKIIDEKFNIDFLETFLNK